MSEEHAIEQTQPVHALCTVDGCDETALYAYTWEWGESGYCCAIHSVCLKHREAALGRPCVLTALRPGAVSPVTQDERIQMHARVLAAEDTVAEVKKRNSDLFEANKELTAEIRRLRIEVSQLTSQVQDARAEAAQLTGEKMAAVKQLAETNHELARLEGVVRATDVGAG